MKELHLSIVSPEKSVFDGDVNDSHIAGYDRVVFSYLPGHAPIVSSLTSGNIKLYHG